MVSINWYDLYDLLAHPWWKRFRPSHEDFGFGHLPSVFSKEFQKNALQKKLEGKVIESVPTTGPEGFQVTVNVQEFKPEEITVKANENSILIEAKHDERPDAHGMISRHFTRRYNLPPGYDINAITSELCDDGFLTVNAPLPKSLENDQNEREVRIQLLDPLGLHKNAVATQNNH